MDPAVYCLFVLLAGTSCCGRLLLHGVWLRGASQQYGMGRTSQTTVMSSSRWSEASMTVHPLT